MQAIPRCHASVKNILIFLAISIASVAGLPDALADVLSKTPKIGLALSGGGARGAAHIGIIRELERQNIRIDYIAGTSMGAIIAGLYASGMNAEQIEQAYRGIDWKDVLNDSPPRQDLSMRRKLDQRLFQLDKKIGVKNGRIEVPAGVIRGQKLELTLQRLLKHVADVNDFDQLTLPFRAIASDIATNETVVIAQGSLSLALRASMAVPGFFTPVRMDDRLLVDGGITNNLPIDVVREMGADIVIAVDIGSPLLKMDETVSMFTIASQLTNILVRRTTDQQIETLGDDDILIVPDIGSFSSSNFDESATLIEIGASAMQLSKDKIQKGEGVPLEKAARLAQLAIPASAPPEQNVPVISYIRVDTDSGIDEAFLRQMLQQKTGQALDLEKLEQDIGRIYGLGTFDSVQYDLEKNGTETGLVLKAKEQAWGPNYLQFGLSLSSDLADSNTFNIRFGYTKMPLNSLNGEWRTIFSLGEEPGVETQLYQPMAVGSPWFIESSAFAMTNKYNVLDGDDVIAETSVFRLGAAFAFGREFGSLGDMRLGLRRYTGHTEITVGDPDLPEEGIDAGEIYFNVRHDSLDNIFFSRRGFKGELGWLGSRTQLGADNDFDQATVNALAARTWGRHTLQLGGSWLTTFNGEAPIQNYFRLGGLFNLPGYSDNQLAAQNALILKSGYLWATKPLLGMPTYLGATLQYGDVYQDRNDIGFSDLKLAGAVYLGLESVIGPVYVGYGLAEGGNQSVYFTIGGIQ
jgi:NTE family protein